MEAPNVPNPQISLHEKLQRQNLCMQLGIAGPTDVYTLTPEEQTAYDAMQLDANPESEGER